MAQMTQNVYISGVYSIQYVWGCGYLKSDSVVTWRRYYVYISPSVIYIMSSSVEEKRKNLQTRKIS